jgi:AAA family ATP:ADP antiporter
VASTTKTASAKKGYPLIFAGAQMGNFCGPALNAGYAIALGNKVMILIASGLILLVPIIMQIYMAVIPAHLHESDYKNESKKKTGALEGLRLIITKPFLMGVLVVSTVYEIIGTVIDYQFKIFAAEYYVGSHYTVFMSFFGMCSATLGLFFTLFGIGMLIRQIGVSRCLLGYPLVLGITVLSLWKMPSLAAFFVAMMAVKAFSYCLNAPIKELLYLPTSKDVKYKAKSFIDGLGIKSAKSAGASIGHAFRSNLPALLQFGSIVSLGVIAIWIVVAIALGNRYDRLIKEKEIIE